MVRLKRRIFLVSGRGDERLTIHSRFANGDDDYFLHYMLQDVLQLNLTSLNVGLSQEDSWYQLLIYLFPKYLQAALRKGLSTRNTSVFSTMTAMSKGRLRLLDILRKMFLYRKITYSTREFSFDNAPHAADSAHDCLYSAYCSKWQSAFVQFSIC